MAKVALPRLVAMTWSGTGAGAFASRSDGGQRPWARIKVGGQKKGSLQCWGGGSVEYWSSLEVGAWWAVLNVKKQPDTNMNMKMRWGSIFCVFMGSKSGTWLLDDALGSKNTQKSPQKGQKAGGHITAKN